MAEEHEEEQIDLEEEWTEPVELDGLPDGNFTAFVGGFSTIPSVEKAEEQLKDKALDRIVVLKGRYAGDVLLNPQVNIEGDASCEASEVVIEGRLIVQKNSTAGVVSHMTFLRGVDAEQLSDADINGCTFGSSNDAAGIPHVATMHAMSKVHFKKCTVYGGEKSAVYGLPHSRVQMTECTVVGNKAPNTVGFYLDDSHLSTSGCSVQGFYIGAYTIDACKGSSMDALKVTDVTTVGLLLGSGCEGTFRNCVVKTCGQQCLVVSGSSHPILRNNVFVGDVRFKKTASAGAFDNVVVLPGKVTDEESVFTLRGFASSVKDPSLAPPPKKKEEEE